MNSEVHHLTAAQRERDMMMKWRDLHRPPSDCAPFNDNHYLLIYPLGKESTSRKASSCRVSRYIALSNLPCAATQRNKRDRAKDHLPGLARREQGHMTLSFTRCRSLISPAPHALSGRTLRDLEGSLLQSSGSSLHRSTLESLPQVYMPNQVAASHPRMRDVTRLCVVIGAHFSMRPEPTWTPDWCPCSAGGALTTYTLACPGQRPNWHLLCFSYLFVVW